jgi:hypothetical protein
MKGVGKTGAIGESDRRNKKYELDWSYVCLYCLRSAKTSFPIGEIDNRVLVHRNVLLESGCDATSFPLGISKIETSGNAMSHAAHHDGGSGRKKAMLVKAWSA